MQQQSQDFWVISDQDRVNYENSWKQFDKQGKGCLTDTEMQNVLQMTKLPKEVCAHVWQLVNPNGEEIFSKPMFMVAIHLMFKKKRDPTL